MYKNTEKQVDEILFSHSSENSIESFVYLKVYLFYWKKFL